MIHSFQAVAFFLCTFCDMVVMIFSCCNGGLRDVAFSLSKEQVYQSLSFHAVYGAIISIIIVFCTCQFVQENLVFCLNLL